jgi:hypothetical protein
MVAQEVLIIMLLPLQEVVVVVVVHLLPTEALEIKDILEVTVTQSIIILVVVVVLRDQEIVQLELNQAMAVLHCHIL